MNASRSTPPAASSWEPLPVQAAASPAFRETPEVLYPDLYTWLVLLSSLDIMLTWKILQFNGLEANPIAALVIDYWGLPGAIAFKYALMLVIIVICEVVGRRRMATGRRILYMSISVTAAVVMYAYMLLMYQVVS